MLGIVLYCLHLVLHHTVLLALFVSTVCRVRLGCHFRFGISNVHCLLLEYSCSYNFAYHFYCVLFNSVQGPLMLVFALYCLHLVIHHTVSLVCRGHLC